MEEHKKQDVGNSSNISEHFCSYNQALALKELGFDEPCIAFYSKQLLTFHTHGIDPHFIFKRNTELWSSPSAPLKQQVFKWFRDEYNINHVIDKHRKFGFWIKLWNNLTCLGEFDEIKTYEEAESACIDKLIEIIKEKKS